MMLAKLTEPLTDLPPCGPDLEAQEDAAFLDYYFEAESRLPERYFLPGHAPDGSDERLFDPKSVDLAAETAQITQLLGRSRDLRLLSLLARFQILANRLGDFAATLDVIARMLEDWDGEVHPQLVSSATDRRGAIEALNTQATVVMPLLHVPVLTHSDLTLRRFMVSQGKADPRPSERDIVGTDILSGLREEGALVAATVTLNRLRQAASALDRIRRLAGGKDAPRFRPELGAVIAAVEDLQQMIALAQPSLTPWSGTAEAEPVAEESGPDAAPAPVETPAPARDTPSHVPGIADRATARAALEAAKSWLVRQEPSSPALLLVVQARELVGASLVQAMEALLPAKAGSAVLHLGRGSGFSLPMDRLRSLTQTGLSQSDDSQDRPSNLPSITGRSDLVGLILGVEAYYLRYEPASPVPLLLVKAREMLDKRFDAIVSELIASPQSGEG
ncbi:ImpA family type VI secretion system protein [Paracoccus sulfuroxidans]|uniref:Type VI secretion system protein ImpA n=1 Tax=Paracoccus sulfuroxidans TaxID=384678 RepID=A0A562NNK5_9RHOB|nr:type VI secretion system ImpA family N-terminal domain-containing protein [Paracoccus sulfuroxidans]TWI33772.1 type VI secretion system protein ImpA [Paracoccus sulfuroxidans]